MPPFQPFGALAIGATQAQAETDALQKVEASKPAATVPLEGADENVEQLAQDQFGTPPAALLVAPVEAPVAELPAVIEAPALPERVTPEGFSPMVLYCRAPAYFERGTETPEADIAEPGETDDLDGDEEGGIQADGEQAGRYVPGRDVICLDDGVTISEINDPVMMERVSKRVLIGHTISHVALQDPALAGDSVGHLHPEVTALLFAVIRAQSAEDLVRAEKDLQLLSDYIAARFPDDQVGAPSLPRGSALLREMRVPQTLEMAKNMRELFQQLDAANLPEFTRNELAYKESWIRIQAQNCITQSEESYAGIRARHLARTIERHAAFAEDPTDMVAAPVEIQQGQLPENAFSLRFGWRSAEGLREALPNQSMVVLFSRLIGGAADFVVKAEAEQAQERAFGAWAQASELAVPMQSVRMIQAQVSPRTISPLQGLRDELNAIRPGLEIDYSSLREVIPGYDGVGTLWEINGETILLVRDSHGDSGYAWPTVRPMPVAELEQEPDNAGPVA